MARLRTTVRWLVFLAVFISVILLLHRSSYTPQAIREHQSRSDWHSDYMTSDDHPAIANSFVVSRNVSLQGTETAPYDSTFNRSKEGKGSDPRGWQHSRELKVTSLSQVKLELQSTHIDTQHTSHNRHDGIASPVSPRASPQLSDSNSFDPVLRRKNNLISEWDSPREDKEGSSNRTGFVLAIHFWDQQTYSVGNILGLQRWAAWLGVHTVEPFFVGTKFTFPLADTAAFYSNGTVSHMRMRDIYDIDSWNSWGGKLHYEVSPLMSWDYFLKTASKIVIYVKLMNSGNCILEKEIASYNDTLVKLGFKLVKAHCVYFSMTQSTTLPKVKAQVYGDLSPSQTTVIFNVWSQLTVPRVATGNNNLIIAGNIRLPLKPSTLILSDAKQYRLKYLPSNGSYIGILVRAEWLIMNKGIDSRKNVLSDCFKRAISWLKAAMNQTHLSSVFVGMDIGKYGSKTLKDLTQDYTLKLSEDFLQNTYHTTEMTMKKWEKMFKETSRSEVPGYIAFLQKTIATHGKCLLLIGFGSFQNHALQAYIEQHQPKHYCYLKTDSQCRIKSAQGFKP